MKPFVWVRFAILMIILVCGSLLINWHSIITWILGTQQHLHLLLREHVSAVAQDPWNHGWLLILVSFGYGLFHAAGPGHGKAFITSYLGTQTSASIRQGIGLSFMGSLFQSLVAILIVSSFALVLNIALGRINNHEWILELVSYGLVALLGALMLTKALVQKYRNQARHAVDLTAASYQPMSVNTAPFSISNTTVPVDLHGTHCGCQHHINISNNTDWKEKLLLVTAMGFRPCSGALIVLVYAHLIGVYGFGIAAVIAMGIGTGSAVALIAFLVVHCRQWLTRRFNLHRQDKTIDSVFWLKVTGGALLLALGLSLLFAVNISPPSHPIL